YALYMKNYLLTFYSFNFYHFSIKNIPSSELKFLKFKLNLLIKDTLLFVRAKDLNKFIFLLLQKLTKSLIEH
mgnify:CR=1